MRVLIVSVLLACVLSACGGSGLPASSQPEAFVDYTKTVLPELLDDFEVPGASVALIDDGMVFWSAGFGEAEVDTGAAVTGDTLFRAASISKAVTAWAVMRLVESGLVDLDAPINTYLSRWQIPDGHFDAEAVTLRRLLGHAAGTSLSYVGFFESDEALPTLEGMLSGVGGEDAVEVVAQPGSKYLYSGGGYIALELLVEEVTGRSFAEWVESELFEPLNMTNSTFDQRPQIEDASVGHDANGRPVPPYVYVGAGAAGLFSTADDLGRFVAAAMPNAISSDRVVLAPDTIELMVTAVVATDEPGIEQGLGYFLDQRSSAPLVGHTGSDLGWNAKILFAPSQSAGIVILTNSDNGTPLHIELGCRWAAWATSQPLDDVCP